MKKSWWSALCILLFLACTSPEKKAKKILDEFSKELTAITDVENLSAYDLSNRIDKAYAQLEKNQKSARKELKKAEAKELFDEAFDIQEVPVYFSLLEELTKKNLTALEALKGKAWINAESGEASSMFTLDNRELKFLNYAKQFKYEVVNGKIMFDEKSGVSPVYFELEGNNLTVKNGKGESVTYREATIEEAIQGEWLYVSAITFKKNGKGERLSLSWNDSFVRDNFSYKIDKNQITLKDKYNTKIYKYNSPWDLREIHDETFGKVNWKYERQREKGKPEALNFLFDGNVKNSEEQKTQVSYSTSSNNGTAGASNQKSGNDWDSILDDYEEYFDQYVKLFKKAQNGDINALTEYTKMLEKAQSIGSKLEQAKGDLTPAQSARFLKIQQKLLNAASAL